METGEKKFCREWIGFVGGIVVRVSRFLNPRTKREIVDTWWWSTGVNEEYELPSRPNHRLLAFPLPLQHARNLVPPSCSNAVEGHEVTIVVGLWSVKRRLETLLADQTNEGVCVGHIDGP